jgi:formamidopyrimidine-DNA glycosylase
VPKLPDLALYLAALERRMRGQALRRIRLASPFLLRTVSPPLDVLQGQTVEGFRRVGKRLVFCFPAARFLVLHLMVAGRLFWRPAGAAIPGGGRGLAAFDVDDGTLILTEAGAKKRASLHLVEGEAALAAMDPGGLEPIGLGLAAFAARLTAANHTLKRALTDPAILAGIGNAYSDEILHRARLSPVAMTRALDAASMARLHRAVQDTVVEWTASLAAETGAAWPEKVTAFRPDMAVHGKFGRPCPVCGAPVQRIRHASNETNYCARCQTGGRLLVDRSLSRLLKGDWPRDLDELAARRATATSARR